MCTRKRDVFKTRCEVHSLHVIKSSCNSCVRFLPNKNTENRNELLTLTCISQCSASRVVDIQNNTCPLWSVLDAHTFASLCGVRARRSNGAETTVGQRVLNFKLSQTLHHLLKKAAELVLCPICFPPHPSLSRGRRGICAYCPIGGKVGTVLFICFSKEFIRCVKGGCVMVWVLFALLFFLKVCFGALYWHDKQMYLN